MRYLNQVYEHRFTERKSEFITLLVPISSQNEIKTQLDRIRKEYPKATHYCSASFFGDNAEHATADDDGEPSRTAGIPILEILKHFNVTNVLAVVIRYFGGIKLGANGLIRAYSKGPNELLKTVDFYKKKKAKKYTISFPYHLIDTFDTIFQKDNLITNKEYLENVIYELVLDKDQENLLDEVSHLAEITLDPTIIELFFPI